LDISTDFIIVGSGLTGAVIARTLADAGGSVLVLERRSHIGGNVFDYCHESGIRVHAYGPHYFRTSSDKIWRFVNRFAEFYKYEAVVKTYVDGAFENWPIAASYIRKTVGEGWRPDFKGVPDNFEEACLGMMPRLIYEKFVRGYTEKQWGVKANSLAASLAKRFDVRNDDDPRLMQHRYQGLPVMGYAQMMGKMLAGIPVLLNCDYLLNRDCFHAKRKLIFTGAIDEFFGFDQGKLLYRGQRREHCYDAEAAYLQPCGQVNNPSREGGAHIRTMEWKHMMKPELASRIRGSVITNEITITPSDPNSYEYPFPTNGKVTLYESYRSRLAGASNLLVCGRLGEYRYYDMDQAIGRAMVLAEGILRGDQ
jgi:UDP-galactopyranose mutase